MVLGVIENCERYYSLHQGFKEAFDFLKKSSESMPAPGKYEIQGDRLFAVVQQYETSSAKDNKYEGHRKYIDIQFMLSGREIIEWANITEAPADAKYDEGNDFLDTGEVEGTGCKLSRGSFAILYPEDLHKPRCVWGESCPVDKIVVKVAL